MVILPRYRSNKKSFSVNTNKEKKSYEKQKNDELFFENGTKEMSPNGMRRRTFFLEMGENIKTNGKVHFDYDFVVPCKQFGNVALVKVKK